MTSITSRKPRTSRVHFGSVSWGLALLCVYGCAANNSRPTSTTEPAEVFAAIDQLLNLGCHECLAEAASMLQASALPPDAPEVRNRRLRIAFLTILKEKELGVLERSEESLAETSAAGPPQQRWQQYSRIVDAIGINAGYFTDTTLARIDNLRSLWELQKTEFWQELRAPSADAFETHLYLAAACSGGVREDVDLPAIGVRFSSNWRIKFTIAICHEKDRVRLEEVLEREPRYHSAHLHLGNLDFSARSYQDAESHFIEVLEHLPHALGAMLPLARMYLELGEMEKGRSLYRRIVELAPEHRDGLLGLGQTLGYLGEHARAIETLDRMIALGGIYLGEAHYWLAWNRYQLDELSAAQQATDASKRYQPMDAPTFFLSGAIAVNIDDLARAETEFNKALEFDADHCEASHELAKLTQSSARDRDSAIQFESAGECYGKRQDDAAAAIRELREGSAPNSAWLGSQTARYESRTQDALRGRADVNFQAAKLYATVGDSGSALRCATIATEHPDFDQDAKSLIGEISR